MLSKICKILRKLKVLFIPTKQHLVKDDYKSLKNLLICSKQTNNTEFEVFMRKDKPFLRLDSNKKGHTKKHLSKLNRFSSSIVTEKLMKKTNVVLFAFNKKNVHRCF